MFPGRKISGFHSGEALDSRGLEKKISLRSLFLYGFDGIMLISKRFLPNAVEGPAMESLERLYDILCARLRASLEKLRKTCKNLQEQWRPDRSSKDSRLPDWARELLAASKPGINRRTVERNSAGKAASEEPPALKAESERTAAAEKTLVDEVAAAKKKIARLAAEKADVEKALAKACTFARQEAERSAAEREAAEQEFTERLAAMQSEVYRITAEKALAEKSLKAELLKVRTDLEGGVAERAPAAVDPTEKRGPAKAWTVMSRMANRIPARFVMGLVCGELAVAVGILVYVIAAPYHPLNPHVLKPGDTPRAPSPTNTRKAVITAPVDGKRVLTDSALGKSPAAVPAVAKTHLRSHSNKKVRATAAKMKGKMKPAVAARPPASSASLVVKHAAKPQCPKCSEYTFWQRNMKTQPRPGSDAAKDAGSQTPQKKYRVDMYPFARY